MKNAVFWDVAPYGFNINRRFGGTCRLYFQGRRNNTSQSVSNRLTLFLACVISSVLRMEATCSSETSVYNKPTGRHIPEGGILHSHRSENLNPWMSVIVFQSTLNMPRPILLRGVPLRHSTVLKVRPGAHTENRKETRDAMSDNTVA
jgi:hypothetical protein